MTVLYSPAPVKLGSVVVAHGFGESSSIISSSSTSSSDGTGSTSHPRGPSSGEVSNLRRFTPCSDDVGTDDSRGTSVAGVWVRGDGDDARCRLSISEESGTMLGTTRRE